MPQYCIEGASFRSYLRQHNLPQKAASAISSENIPKTAPQFSSQSQWCFQVENHPAVRKTRATADLAMRQSVPDFMPVLFVSPRGACIGDATDSFYFQCRCEHLAANAEKPQTLQRDAVRFSWALRLTNITALIGH
jgi:hypothetical protein